MIRYFPSTFWFFLIATTLTSITYSASSKELTHAAQYGAEGKVTFRIVDDQGNAVPDANVDASLFEKSSYANVKLFKGQADTNGNFVVEGKTIGEVRYLVTAKEHYKTEDEYWFYSSERGTVKEGRWIPWDSIVSVVLKPMKNPIPMYAKRVGIEIPEQGKLIGFDMAKGDWVAPYGQGSVSDFLIDVFGIYKELLDRHSVMTISFENAEDGLQGIPAPDDGSEFQSMYEAPMMGYATNYVYEKKISRVGSERINPKPRTDKYHLFRVRSNVDEDGKVVSANYGKIYRDIVCDFIDEKRIGVYFTYYFNPTPNDRNLEFDPKQNLFKNLSSQEEVREP